MVWAAVLHAEQVERTVTRQIGGQTVTHIGNGAFSGKPLTGVTFENNSNVTTIGTSAFSGLTNLTQVNFGTSPTLQTIGNSAFSGCTGMSQISIPASVNFIGDNAFKDCINLSNVYISDNTNTYSDATPFSGCTKLYGLYVSTNQTHHHTITNTGKLIWLRHDYLYNGNHSPTQHDLICDCGHETPKEHDKKIIDGIEICTTCPWVGDVHNNHNYTHSYTPIPHDGGKFAFNEHKAYCACGAYVKQGCLGEIAGNGKAYCIFCARDMTGAFGTILNVTLPGEVLSPDEIIQGINCLDINYDYYYNEYYMEEAIYYFQTKRDDCH